VLEALRRRYEGKDGEWVFFEEAWRIDAYAIRCYSSDPGHLRRAFEVKVSRGDFLSEMKKPSKRQYALDVSHEFYFVTPAGLVRKEEIPAECGLIFVNDDGSTKLVKRAPRREARALRMSEVAYLMRVPLFREGLLEMRRKMLAHEQSSKMLDAQVRREQANTERALARLRAYAGHLVVEGSMWRGSWQPGYWMTPVENVEVAVENLRVYDDDGPQIARYCSLRRMDTGEVNSFMPVDDLLLNFSPLQ
jgi:hypothetical protein